MNANIIFLLKIRIQPFQFFSIMYTINNNSSFFGLIYSTRKLCLVVKNECFLGTCI